MDIVLLGLSQPRLQHLASALRQTLKQFAPSLTIHSPQNPTDWTAPLLPSRILLCVNSDDAANAQAWRDILMEQGLSFQVIHGIGQELVTQCLLALLPPDCFNPSGFAMTTSMASNFEGLARKAQPLRWQGVCETCSDPDCEQRLFSGLLQGR